MKVYITINKITKSYYVGITNGHKKNYFGSGVALRDAIKKYGTSGFRKFIIEKCENRIIASERERYWIKICKQKWSNRKCLNLTDGGENSFIRNKDVQDRINLKLKKYYIDRPELKDKLRNHAKNTLVKYIKEHGVWNKNVGRKYVPRENGNNGSNNFFSKLTEEQVKEIRKSFNKKKDKYVEYAKKYQVSYQTISRIINNKNWVRL